MTRTSFPWEKTKSEPASAYPWEKAESNSFPWQKPAEEEHRYPWDSKPAVLSSTNPFDGKKGSFPWEKTSSTVPSSSVHDDRDVFVFGKSGTSSQSSLSKPTGGKYSAIYRENNFETSSQSASLSKASVGGEGTFSSIYRGDKEKRAMFPWEKQSAGAAEEDSLEAQLSEYLKLQHTPLGEDELSTTKREDQVEKEKEKPEKETKQASNKSPKGKQKSKTTRKKVEKTSDKSSDTVSKESKPEIKVNIEVPTGEEKASSVNLEADSKTEEESKQFEELQIDVSKPITSPVVPPKQISKSPSVTKLASKDKPARVKSAPPVPRHINRKSEMLARKYMSAYAKPRIALKEPAEETSASEARKSYRQEQSINEWVYPPPTEPVDWKMKSDQNLPLKTESESDLESRSLDSTSLREAAFQKWIHKKKENKTFRKSDMMTVIDSTADVPSAESIRQARFEEWYRARTVAADKKLKEKQAEEERKLKEEEEAKTEKTRQEQLNRRLWDEKDKERKEKIRKQKEEDAKKIAQKKEEESEKRKNADKTFNMWSERKDPKLKEQAKKKKLEEKETEEEKRNEQEMKEIEAQKSFKAWKEGKEEEEKCKRDRETQQKKQKQEKAAREKREKEAARAKQLEQWTSRKEVEKSVINIPAHISPWKDGSKPNAIISRDEKLMADIKFKKMRQKRRPQRQSQDTETHVEFIR